MGIRIIHADDPAQPYSPISELQNYEAALFLAGRENTDEHKRLKTATEDFVMWLASDRSQPAPCFEMRPLQKAQRAEWGLRNTAGSGPIRTFQEATEHLREIRANKAPVRPVTLSIAVGDGPPAVITIDSTHVRFAEIVDDSASVLRTIVSCEYLPADSGSRHAAAYELKRSLHRLAAMGAIPKGTPNTQIQSSNAAE